MRGIPALARVLCEIQAQRLAKAIPAIQTKITKLLLLRQDELEKMPLIVSVQSRRPSILASRFLQNAQGDDEGHPEGRYRALPL